MKNKNYVIYFVILFFLISSQIFLNQNCKKADEFSGLELIKELVGSWSGTWTDTKYDLSGSLSVTFTQNGDIILANGIIDLSAFWFGDFPGTGTGTADGAVKSKLALKVAKAPSVMPRPRMPSPSTSVET